MGLIGVHYLIDLQKYKKLHEYFKNVDNLNLTHIGLRLLRETFEHYRFDFYDDQRWSHFELVET